MARNAGVPSRYLDYRWSSIEIVNADQRKKIQGILQYAQNFQDMKSKGVSLCWLGKPGTGKSLLASLVVMHILRSGYRAVLMDWADIVCDLQEAERFDSEKTKKKIYADLVYPDLLVIDEMEGDTSEKVRREIQRILNKRYNEVLPTVLIGNLDMDEFRNAVGDRVVSRIRQSGGGIVAFEWQDFRYKR